jgi:NAD/NADP transhydrogenase alpha subunit
MNIALFKEVRSGENRVALTPQICSQLIKMGHQVFVEKGAGDAAHFSDQAYTQAGAKVMQEGDLLGGGNIFVQINVPTADRIAKLPEGSIWISLLYHRTETEVVKALNSKKLQQYHSMRFPAFHALKAWMCSVLKPTLRVIARYWKALRSWIRFFHCS